MNDALHPQLHPTPVKSTEKGDRDALNRDAADLHARNMGQSATRTPTRPLARPDATEERPFASEGDTRCLPSAPESAPTPARPVAPAPIVQHIPAELQARRQWVVWRYELVKGKWTKVPYTPDTTCKAAANRASTWRPFSQALACYQARPDYFDGIGYVFAEDDPYVGGDIDHDLRTDRLPPTYAEISPSGQGIKFIARDAGIYGRKTKRGELYSNRHFFTITGNVLPGHEQIAACHAAIEAFAASLGKPAKAHTDQAITEGEPGAGNRAEIVSTILESEWETGRQLWRTDIHRLLARVRAAAGEETQLAVLLRREYVAFHARWPHVGLFRADGTLDDSQIRAVAAFGIKGRGFTFPEYIAIMSHLYAAEALAKWGAKQRWREELAALWHKAPAPRFAPRRAAPTPRAPRGRACDHATLVERVYTLLQDHQAGAEAVVKTSVIAAVIGTARETVARILGELRATGRIQTRRLGQYGGLVVTFSDVIYSAPAEADSPQPSAPNLDPPAAALEETEITNCVSSDRALVDHSSPALPALADLVRDCFDAYAGARITLARVARYVEMNAGGRVHSRSAIALVTARERRRRVWARRDAREAECARLLKWADLEKKSRAVASQAAAMRRAGDKRAPIWERRAGILAAEETRRNEAGEAPSARLLSKRGVTVEQALLLMDLDEVRKGERVSGADEPSTASAGKPNEPEQLPICVAQPRRPPPGWTVAMVAAADRAFSRRRAANT